MDDVVLDEFGALARAVFRVLDGAFPFQHGPAREIILRHLGEDRGEIDLAIAQGAEAPYPVDPALIAGIDALTPTRVELGILDLEKLDALVVNIDEIEIIELLQHHVAGIVEDVGARAIVDPLKEHLESHAVEQVLAEMQFEADIHAILVKRVEDRGPA